MEKVLIISGIMLLAGCSKPIGGGHVLFDDQQVCCSGKAIDYTAKEIGTAYYVDRNSGKTLTAKAVAEGSRFQMDPNTADNLLQRNRLNPDKADMILYMVPKPPQGQCSIGGCS